MNKKTWMWLGGFAVLGVAAFVVMNSKQSYAKAIVKNGGSGNYYGILRFDKSFLKEWAKAAKLGASTFIHEGKVYITSGGKVQQG